MSNTYIGKVAKSPKVTDKSIFFLLELENAKTLAVIGFFKNLDKEYIAELREFKVDQEVSFLGKEHTNNKSGAKEIVIESPVRKEISVEEAMNTSLNLEPVEERTLPERKYSFKHPKSKEEVIFWSDGIYFWTQGKTSDKRKLNYNFIDTYNTYVKSEKWLLPDWYIIEVAKINETNKALLTEFAIY